MIKIFNSLRENKLLKKLIYPFLWLYVNKLYIYTPRFLRRIVKKGKITVRYSTVFSIIAIIILSPFVYYGLIKPGDSLAGWAPGFENWLKRKQLTITNNSSGTVSTNSTIAITVDTQSLYNLGYLQSNCDDLRVVYESGSNHKELTRHLIYPAGTTCSTSGSTKVYFNLQADITTTSSSTNYYMYYQNSSASSPTSTDNAFDISTINATLVCPFDSSTTCAAGETPSTESGAVRYSGSKGALSFDEYDDNFYFSPLTTAEGTIEFWFYPKRYGTYGVGDYLFNKPVSTWNGFAIFMQTAGNIYVNTGGTNRIISSSTVTLNQWQHIALTFGSGGMTLYINGVSKGTSAVTDGLDDYTASYIVFGNTRNTDYSAPLGYIDEFRISKNVRYTSSFTPSAQPFVRDNYTELLYHFDENGNDPRNSGEVKDDSGNNYDGTLVGTSFVGGLVGVDSSSTSNATGYINRQSYASHEGIFVEEGTTNKITNPSFENSTYDTNWTANSSATISSNTSESYYKFGSTSALVQTTTTSYTSSSTTTGLYTTTSNKRLAQGFQTSSSASPVSVDLYLQRNGSATRYIQVEIQTDSSGLPSGTAVTNGVSNCLAYSSINQNPQEYQNFTFSTAPSLSATTQYHLVLKTFSDTCSTEQSSIDATNYIRWYHHASGTYSSGQRATMADTGTWTGQTGTDFAFKVHENTSSFVTSINAGNTNNHILSAYVFNASYFAENDHEYGETVDSTVAQLIYNGSAVTTTYTNIGDGWWRLSYSAAGINGSANYGVEVKSAKAIYIDGVQLEEKSYATSYTDGSLGTGYSWSGTANNSTSDRTKTDLYYPATAANISQTAGSVSFWLKTPWAGNDSVLHELFAVDTSAGTLRLYKDTDNSLKLYDGTNTASKAVSWAANTWQHITADWGSSNMHVYVNNSVGTAAGAFSTPTINTSGYINIGENTSEANQANGTISDFRIFDGILTSTQVSDIYYAGLIAHSEGISVDRFQGDKGQDPLGIFHFDEGYGTTAYDSSTYSNNMTITGATWDIMTGQSIGNRSLKFDGTGDYLSRNDTDFDFGTDSFSISGWFKHSSTTSGTQTILARYGTAGYKVYMNSSGYICFDIDSDGTWGTSFYDSACTSTSYADSKWHHFEAVKNSTTSITLFIDGQQAVQDSTIAANTTLTSVNTTMYMGMDSDGSSNGWIGWLDEIYIYNYARSSTQIIADHADPISARFGSSVQDPLSQNLLAWWKLDESSGNGTDSSGNNNTATDATTTVLYGKYGNGRDFSGSSGSYMSASSFNVSGNQITLSAWINLDSFGTSTDEDIIIRKGTTYGTSNNVWLLNIQDSKVWFVPKDTNISGTCTAGENCVLGATTLSANTWYHIAGTYDGATMKVYINGVLDGSVSSTSGVANSSNTVFIGGRSDNADMTDGTIDDLRVYDRALSPAEIQQLYNWSPGPVSYWQMDENTGTTISDSSGNGNTSSTFTNNVAWTTGKFGAGLSFDGTDDVVQITESTTTDLGATTDSYSVEAWFKTTTNYSGNAYIVAKDADATTPYPYLLYLNSSEYGCFQIGEGANTPSACGTTALNDGNWHHVAGVRDVFNDKLYLYIDGVAITNTTDSTTATTANNDNLSIGNGGTSYTTLDFNGQIDDVKIYNYARSIGQIVEDMNAGHPAPGSPVESAYIWYKFDEGNQTTAYNSGNSGSSLNGTITSGTWTNSGRIGKALTFSASTSVTATITDPAYTNSISLWVYPTTDAASKTLVTATKLTTDSSSRPVYGGCTGTALSLSVWQHILAVSNGTGYCAIYQNGQLTSSSTTGVTFGTSLNIGGTSFTGNIDEVKLYTLALTVDQAKIEYNLGKSQVLGAVGTDSSGNPNWGDDRFYCQPGDTTASCSPIAEWKLDENTGTQIFDTSGNNNISTSPWTGTQTWVPGKIGTALNFNNNNGVVRMLETASTTDLGAVGTSYSVSAWYKTTDTSSSTDAIVYKMGANSGPSLPYPFKLYVNTSSKFPAFQMEDSVPTVVVSSYGTATNDGKWHHLVGINNATDSKTYLYVDGILQDSDSTTSLSGSLANNYDISIGNGRASYNTDDFNGEIDQVRIYNYALSSAQVAWDYNLGEPHVFYKADECTGSTLNNSAPTASGDDADHDATIYPQANDNTATGTCSSGTGTEMWNDGTTGKYNASLGFDGNDDYAVSSASILVNSVTQTYTNVSWGAWVNTNATPNGDVILQRGNPANSTQQEFRLTTDTNGVPQCGVCTAGVCSWNSATGTTALTTGSWTHLICTYDGANIKLYVNGNLNGITAHTGVIASRATGVQSIARDPQSSAGTYINALIDEVKIWTYDLTSQQVKSDYNAGKAVKF